MANIPLLTAILTYFGYGFLVFLGHVRDFLSSLKRNKNTEPGFAPLCRSWEDFYTRRLYHRIHDAWQRPICSAPGAWIEVMTREVKGYHKPLRLTGETQRCLNLSSYNYLGFGDPDSPCKPDVLAALDKYSVASGSFRSSMGNLAVHRELEQLVARYIGKEDAMIFGMGFGTNSTVLPSLAGRGCLLISDANNHSSIVVGARSSGATIKVFKHNDTKDLEKVIRRAIIQGQPRKNRAWKKIIVVVEGIYSMEGEMSPLDEIVRIKKKYKCYLFVDEAHSIGAIGKTGRGITEYKKVNPADVDVLMGTFTKSFGGVGGYIAADKEVIAHLRRESAGYVYTASMSPPAAQQALSAIKIILGEDGTDIGAKKLRQLRDNSNYFRAALNQMGCFTLGDADSPIMPVMLFNPAKIIAFSRVCLENNLAVVVVGFPATPLLLARTRFCISAAHTLEDLEDAIAKIRVICEQVGILYKGSSGRPALRASN